MPMVLHPYQVDLIEQWTDPFIKTHATCIAAGGAETTTLAAYTVAHLFLTDEADVPIIADTVQQAWSTTLGIAARFVEASPELEGRMQVLRDKGYMTVRSVRICVRELGQRLLKPQGWRKSPK